MKALAKPAAAVAALVFILMLLQGCDGESASPLCPSCDRNNSEPDYSLYADEAERMAAWLIIGPDPRPPQSLTDTLARALWHLRDEYLDDIPGLAVTFMLPWAGSQLFIGLSDSAFSEFEGGTYDAWDSLNTLYGVKSIGVGSTQLKIASLRFSDVFHMGALAYKYSRLDGVRYAEPNSLVGDWSNLYPWIRGEVVSFLLRSAYGDCMAGCIHSDFWYFRVTGDEVEYVGATSNSIDPPAWWGEASVAYICYRFGGCPIEP